MKGIWFFVLFVLVFLLASTAGKVIALKLEDRWEEHPACFAQSEGVVLIYKGDYIVCSVSEGT
jgi:hypothetical protein